MSHYALKNIKGVIPAMLTFYDADENIDEQVTRDMVDYMIGAGVNGLYLTGSTGTCFTMNAAERKHVVEIVVDQVKGRVPVIVHVGDIGTKNSIDLAEHAAKAGADAISSVPPFYWKFSRKDIYNYYRDLAGATDLPLVVYNIELAGTMDRALLEDIAKIDGVGGLKYTSRSHDELGALKSVFGPDFMVYSGCDEMAFSGLSFGADGIIGSFYNVLPELFLKLYNAVQAGNIKEGIRCQKLANGVIFEALKYDFPSVLHTLLDWRGLKGGNIRRPFKKPSAEETKPLAEALRKLKAEKDPQGELDIFKAL